VTVGLEGKAGSGGFEIEGWEGLGKRD